MDIGGLDSFAPGEDGGNASEGLSEEAKQRFSGASQAVQQVRKEEKKAKKRDDNVAQVILQFLSDDQRTHLATLIARLVAIDCPSHFILSILALVNDACQNEVAEYLKDASPEVQEGLQVADTSLVEMGTLDAAANHRLAEWIAMQNAVLNADAFRILSAIIIDERNIDGTVLQLTTFVLQEFLEEHGKPVEFEKLQPVAIDILQSVLAPHIQAHLERRIAEKGE
jgi:hypothetical protein